MQNSTRWSRSAAPRRRRTPTAPTPPTGASTCAGAPARARNASASISRRWPQGPRAGGPGPSPPSSGGLSALVWNFAQSALPVDRKARHVVTVLASVRRTHDLRCRMRRCCRSTSWRYSTSCPRWSPEDSLDGSGWPEFFEDGVLFSLRGNRAGARSDPKRPQRPPWSSASRSRTAFAAISPKAIGRRTSPGTRGAAVSPRRPKSKSATSRNTSATRLRK